MRNVIYHPGCLTRVFCKKIGENYKRILESIGLKFVVDDKLCCGSPLLNAGYKKEFDRLVEKNLHKLMRNKIGKIITNCPACFKVFSEDYGFNTVHVTKVIWENIEKLKLRNYKEEVMYHDPCYLSRFMRVYDEPRYILEALGFEIVEFGDNKERTMCCGAGGGLKANLKRTANRIAKLRLREVKTRKLITSCPLCYMHLKENAEGINVLELSEVLI